MTTVGLLELAAWAGGAAMLGWMVLDAWRTGRAFDEQVLLSSREGEIEEDLGTVQRELAAVDARLEGGKPDA